MKKETFDRLTKSLEQMTEIRAGRMKAGRVTRMKTANVLVISPARIKAIRESIGLSQADFAALLNIPAATLRNWEQGRTEPDGPAKALLRVAESKPKAVLDALHA